MRFTVKINTADGSTRTALFECQYDAVAVLTDLIERNVLDEGESIATKRDPHEHGNSRKQVPHIERIM